MYTLSASSITFTELSGDSITYLQTSGSLELLDTLIRQLASAKPEEPYPFVHGATAIVPTFQSGARTTPSSPPTGAARDAANPALEEDSALVTKSEAFVGMVRSSLLADRTYRFRTYTQCFVGTEAVDEMVKEFKITRQDAVELGSKFMVMGLFAHVCFDHSFKDANLYYRLYDVADVTPPARKMPPVPLLDQRIPTLDELMQHLNIAPNDPHNEKLVLNVHPPEYKPPMPAEVYNVVVIGAGAGGLVTAAGATGCGARVAIIENHLMGGDCLNVGCVPSKGVIRSGRAAADVRGAVEFGVNVTGAEVDFAKVMERVRKIRAQISHADSVERFSTLGVDVFFGFGVFTASDVIQVGGTVLKFTKAVIATGRTPTVPPIPGLAEAGYLTNMSVFNLTEQPKRLVLIGGGPIGCELAQALARMGTKVAIIDILPHILGREDKDAVEIVQEQFVRDGIDLALNVDKIVKVEVRGGEKVVHVEFKGGGSREIVTDEILVSAGRKPNVDGMNLETAGVKYDPRMGVIVDDHFQTTNQNVYAVGDICFKYQFTHAADFCARAVIRNALFFGRAKASDLLIPWCTYTEPEIAHVGMYEQEAIEKGIDVVTYKKSFDEIDRAILDGETEGFVKVHVKRGSDKILGATIVAKNAGDMIATIITMMRGNVGLGTLAASIFPYPTQAEAIRKLGDDFNRTRLTPTVKRLMGTLMDKRRGE